MGRVNLLGQPYSGKGLIASAQRCVNLYGESNKDSLSPTPMTYYQFPGTELLGTPLNQAIARCIYRTSIGTCYEVVGSNVYFVQPDGETILIGVIEDKLSQVYMADNGLVAVIVDGVNGYAIDLSNNNFGQIIDPSFYGADFALFLNTFFVFNRPGTNQFYISLSMVTFGMLTNTAIATGSITNHGSKYTNGNYFSVPLTGGSGDGALADITIGGTNPAAGVIVGGTLYTNGTYLNVPLTGGAGTGAHADITVAGGAVTVVNLKFDGQNYAIGNVLSATAASIGGTGSGFTFTLTALGQVVTNVSIVYGGENYLIGDTLSVNNLEIGGVGAGFIWTITGVDTAFNPLDIAAKSSSADPIVGIATVHNELWLIGALTTEVWLGTGAADFFFQIVQGAFIDHGSIAPYSIANQDVIVFWISQDKQGSGIIVKGQGYDVTEISTPYIVSKIKTYPTIADAIGMCFQIEDHAFYLLQFPTANATWLYDLKTGFWAELGKWNTATNQYNRYRANCCAFAFGMNLIGDYQTGKIYKLNPNVYTDGGDPIKWLRTFPHLIGDEFERIIYNSCDADIEVGNSVQDDLNAPDPQIFLSWSDNRGKSFGFPVGQSMGRQGEFYTTVSWNRLGYGRDRVFQLEWSEPCKTALNGVFVQSKQAKT